MGLCKRFRDFRGWCPQPPDRLPNQLKKYTAPIAAVVTVSIILSVSFFVFSSSLMSNPSVPIVPLVNGGSSTNPTLLWNFTAGGVLSSLSVVDGTVYVGSSDQNIYALNATNGAKLWNYFNGNFPGTSSGSSPALANGVIYIGDYYAVDALNATNSNTIWSNMPLHDTPLGFSAPTVIDGTVYIGTTMMYAAYYLYAFNAKTGNQLWGIDAAGPVVSSPTVVGDRVYVGVGGSAPMSLPFYVSPSYGVYALNAKNGAQIWNFSTGYSVETSPVVTNGMVYFVSYDGNFYALNAANGILLWNYTTGKAVGKLVNVDSSPSVVNGVVYVGSDDGNVYALNAKDGAKIWNYSTGNGTLSTPTVYDGILYVGSSDNSIYAFNDTTGTKLWTYSTGGSVGSPVVVNGILYVGGGNNVYALRVSSPSASTPASYPIWTVEIGVAVAVLIVVALTVVLIFKKKSRFGVKNESA